MRIDTNKIITKSNNNLTITIEDKLNEIKDFPREIELNYYFCYSRLYCDCLIRDTKYSNHVVLHTSSNGILSIEQAEKLLCKLKETEDKFGKLDLPNPKDQSIEGGYTHKMITDDIEVSFERINKTKKFGPYGMYALTHISKKDKFGFYYLDTPISVEESEIKFYPLKKLTSQNTRLAVNPSDYHLEDNEEIYMWDDIRYLSGTAGLAIVKDGKVIKTKMTMIS